MWISVAVASCGCDFWRVVNPRGFRLPLLGGFQVPCCFGFGAELLLPADLAFICGAPAWNAKFALFE